jgi:hypothetical protein
MPTLGAVLVAAEPPGDVLDLACLAIITPPHPVVYTAQLFLEFLSEREIGIILVSRQASLPFSALGAITDAGVPHHVANQGK